MPHYVLVGPEAVVIWDLDARRGLIGGQKCGTGYQRRYFISAAFSEDGSLLYAGSTSGDVTSFTVNGCVLREVAQCVNGGGRREPSLHTRLVVRTLTLFLETRVKGGS